MILRYDISYTCAFISLVFIYTLPDYFSQCNPCHRRILLKEQDTKISWNAYNKLPYDSFFWKGIDGTKILTHFIPTRDYVQPGRHSDNTTFTSYNGEIHPRQMKGAWQRYQQKNLNHNVLCAYGYGDGGGGPASWMLETQRRLSYGIPGCPKTKQSSALEFFEKLDRDLDGKKVPIWSGELYLEFHRGTYTSMARNKKWNRRGEFALTNLESGALLAMQLLAAEYPNLQAYWEILLRNQFHDILPGSSIFEVYEDSKAEYQKLFNYTSAAERMYLSEFADQVGSTIVWNPNGQVMSGFVELEHNDGRKHVQQTAEGTYLAWAQNIPAKGYSILEDTAPTTGKVEISTHTVDTPYANIILNEKGQITSWFDKTALRQLLQEGRCGNVLMTYEDKPFEYDNWELQDYYREKFWPVDDLICAEVVENGPFRYALKLEWKYQDSIITEILYFYAHTPRVDIRFSTDWKEDPDSVEGFVPGRCEYHRGNLRNSVRQREAFHRSQYILGSGQI